jgi:SAM-dependent methyltransferase
MNESDNRNLDVDALMQQIRAEIASRTARTPAWGPGPPVANQPKTIERDVLDERRVTLSRLAESAAPLPRKRGYTVKDFLDYHDEDFVRNAYRAMLGREPDAEGGRRFLAMLRSGEFAKAEILGRIRYSPEGRAAGVRVSGLLIPFTLRTLRRTPVLGYVLGIVQYVLRLPTIVRNHERLETVVFAHQLEMRRAVNAIGSEIEAALQRLESLAAKSVHAIDGKIEALERSTSIDSAKVTEELNSVIARVADNVDRQQMEAFEQRVRSEGDTRVEQITEQVETLGRQVRGEISASIEVVTRNTSAELSALRSLLDALKQWASEQPPGLLLRETIKVADAAKADASRIAAELTLLRANAGRTESGLAAADHLLLGYRQNLLEQERRLGILLDNVGNWASGVSKGRKLAVVREEQAHLYDSFYVSFEDAFRGTREDIKHRVEIYLPYVREAGAGTVGAPILDIGCGRGEWLELLNDNGLAASGVDLNRVTAGHCRERGLVVAEADGLDYLRGVAAESIGAVTAIHLIEHLPFRQLMCLLDEVRRVLKPGGIAIFETPNPENLIVGSCNFWYDPTHQRPLPPEPMRFILDNRGFTRVEIIRLHPNAELSPTTDVASELPAVIADRFYGPQDYALIGYKS